MDKKTLTHEQAVRKVYELTPQIKEYDDFMYHGVRWLPYIMYHHSVNYKSEIINTDRFGFRHNILKNKIVTLDEVHKYQNVNLLVGGSNVLGTGATRDSFTISSYLSELTGELWINFSGRGWNSTQELIAFLMHQQRFTSIKKVVILSGINTLALEGFPDEYATEYGKFYYSYEYNHYMNQYNEDLKHRTNNYSNTPTESEGVLKKIKNIFSSNKSTLPVNTVIDDKSVSIDKRLTTAAFHCSQNAFKWKQLLKTFGADITFALQPMSEWCNKELTLEEEEIFNAIDSCPNNFWRLFSQILSLENKNKFSNMLQNMLSEHNINFYDTNTLVESTSLINQNIFVDRVHFNDYGHSQIAKLLVKQVI